MNSKKGPVEKEINLIPTTEKVEKKIEFFKDVIQKTILHVQQNKILDILGIIDVNTCVEKLGDISKKIQEITNIHIVPNKTLLLSATLFTSVHIITYSIVGSKKHALQHLNPECNFGPDFVDHVFGTNSDNTFEDMTHYIPNTLIITSVLYFYM